MNEDIQKVAEEVRNYIITKYKDAEGTKDSEIVEGRCIEASELIVKKLKHLGVEAKTVEGWCWFERNLFWLTTDTPCGPHTWVLAGNTYIDITADQFGDYLNCEVPKIIIGERPYYMRTRVMNEEEMDAIGF